MERRRRCGCGCRCRRLRCGSFLVHGRGRCRGALVEAMLGPDDRDAGLAQYDLRESALPDVVEDARSLSLFAPQPVLYTHLTLPTI